MQDSIQQGLRLLAYQNGLTRSIAVFCAVYLVFLMIALWLVAAVRRWREVTIADLAYNVILVVVAYAASTLLSHLFIDPRPYIVEHFQPLTSVSRDNGFPSDHVMLASVLTASLLWVNRRFVPIFLLGTLLVMAGRLAIGAHHTIDVVGSLVVVAVIVFLLCAVPYPSTWRRPLLRRWAKTGDGPAGRVAAE